MRRLDPTARCCCPHHTHLRQLFVLILPLCSPQANLLAPSNLPQRATRCYGSATVGADDVGMTVTAASTGSVCRNRQAEMDWAEIHTLEHHEGAVLALAAEGDFLFTGGADCRVVVWDMTSLQPVHAFQEHTRPVLTLVVGRVAASGRDVSLLLSASSDNSIIVYELGTWRRIACISGYAGDIFCMQVVDNFLFLGSQDTTVKILSLVAVLEMSAISAEDGNGAPVTLKLSDIPHEVLRRHQGFVYSVHVTGETLATAAGDGSVHVYDREPFTPDREAGSMPEPIRVLKGHSGSVYQVLIGSTTIYSTGQDGTIRAWDRDTGYLRRTLTGHSGAVLAMAQSNGNLLFSADTAGKFQIWSQRHLRVLCEEQLPDSVTCMVYLNDLLFFATGSLVKVWSGSEPAGMPAASAAAALVPPRASLEAVRSASSSNLLLAMRDPMLVSLKKFISIKSISARESCRDECWQAAKFYWKLLEHYGFQAQLVEGAAGKNPLVFGRLGQDDSKPTVTMYGHYDVFDVHEEEWSHDPFSMLAKNGFLYGRGTSDDKGPILAMLYACVDLLADGADLPVNVALVIEGEEECDSAGFSDAVQQHIEWFRGTDVVLLSNTSWLGVDRPCVNYGLRGVLSVSVTVSGPSKNLHSGVDGGAVREPMQDLLLLLAGIVDGNGRVDVPGFYDDIRVATELENELYEGIEFDVEDYRSVLGVDALTCEDAKELLQKRWRLPTLSIHTIGSATTMASSTVIPAAVRAKITMRLVPDQDAASIFAKFEAYVAQKFEAMATSNKLNVELLSSGDWWLGDPGNAYFKAAEKSLEEVWGRKPMYTREGGTIPLTAFLEKALHAPAIHLPLGQATGAAHLCDEKMRLTNLTRGKDVIRRFLELVAADAKQKQ